MASVSHLSTTPRNTAASAPPIGGAGPLARFKKVPGFKKDTYDLTPTVRAHLRVKADEIAAHYVGNGEAGNIDEATAATFMYQVSRRLYPIIGDENKSARLASDFLKFLNGGFVVGTRLALVGGKLDLSVFAQFAKGELAKYPRSEAMTIAALFGAIGASYAASWELGQIAIGKSERKASGVIDGFLEGFQISNGIATGTALIGFGGTIIPNAVVNDWARLISKHGFGMADLTGGLADMVYAEKHLTGAAKGLAQGAAGIKILGGFFPIIDQIMIACKKEPGKVLAFLAKGKGATITLAVATIMTLYARFLPSR